MAELIEIKGQVPPVLLDKLIQTLNTGGVIIAASDTVYGLIAKAFDQETFRRLDKIKGRRNLPYAINFASLSGLETWYGKLNPFQRRVAGALLPGPVTLILPFNDRIPNGFRHKKHGLGVRVSSDDLTPELCMQIDAPLWSTSANRSGEPAPAICSRIDKELLDEVDIVLDSGSTEFTEPSTVIDLRRFPYSIPRQGSWLKRVERVLDDSLAPLEVLIVCTGNICRSPLAAALLQHLLGNQHESGVHVSSAGTYASAGLPATYYMIEIAAEWGIDLSEHEGNQLTEEVIHSTDIILTAEPHHRDWIVESFPDAEDRVEMLGYPIGLESIPDPYGSVFEAYERTAELIRLAVTEWQHKLQAIIREAGWRAR